MKIVQLTPGSGDNFYCENCLRDAGLVRAMRERGGDVMMIPMYLPLQADRDEQVSDGPLFFGGVNVYLQQKTRLFRRTPRWVDKMFDSKRLLGWVGKFAGMTSAKELGETTISMLLGEDGKQKKELDRLVDWLAVEENRPGVVCLSNALLAGLAEPIKERVKVPVVCMLQDEDGFVDGLGEEYGGKAWEILREKVRFVDRFVAVSEYYADEMAKRLDVDRGKFEVVGPGVKVDEYGQAVHGDGGEKVIGFLSRMCKEKGLDILVDAFILLRQDGRFGGVKLAVGGGRSRSDEVYIAGQMNKLERCGLG
ncbi:MAG: glycosyltransferase, partial [Anaerohalosphaera sp.]|nr:glycosyltransferase [Anaerohalosphaera sp.]